LAPKAGVTRHYDVSVAMVPPVGSGHGGATEARGPVREPGCVAFVRHLSPLEGRFSQDS
jgi:hypothetical protein